MYLNVLFFPFLSFLLVGLFGRFFGRFVSKYLAVSCIFFTFIFSLFIFYEIGLCHSIVVVELYNWVSLYEHIIGFGLLFDSLTCIMLVIISFISFIVHLYCLDYMEHDPFLCRFMCYLSLFTFFMEFLVTADNFIQMFIG